MTPKPETVLRPTLAQIEQRIAELMQVTTDTLECIDDEQEASLFKEKMDELITDLRDMEAEKIDAYGSFISRNEAEDERLGTIIKNLQERKKRVTNRIERAKAHLLDTMFSTGVKKLEGTVFIARFTTSESVEIDNPDTLADEYVRTKKEPDKVAIKAALSAGASNIPAHIKTNYSVSVKTK